MVYDRVYRMYSYGSNLGAKTRAAKLDGEHEGKTHLFVDQKIKTNQYLRCKNDL